MRFSITHRSLGKVADLTVVMIVVTFRSPVLFCVRSARVSVFSVVQVRMSFLIISGVILLLFWLPKFAGPVLGLGLLIAYAYARLTKGVQQALELWDNLAARLTHLFGYGGPVPAAFPFVISFASKLLECSVDIDRIPKNDHIDN